MDFIQTQSVQLSILGTSTAFNGKTAKTIALVIFFVLIIVAVKVLQKPTLSINVG